MAGLSTAVAFKQVAFAREDAALAFCEMQRAWQSCLASVTGKRFQEAETYAVKKWAEARQSAVTLLTGSSAASPVPSTSAAAAPTTLTALGAATPPPAGVLTSWSYGLLG